ncbi:MAG: hypothetical protein ASARMPRED_004606 [Alectoria sarmentosa]|nr:MAG: hypothetical protein ASARMPRED_004606 [Alectoria sarmentosa]
MSTAEVFENVALGTRSEGRQHIWTTIVGNAPSGHRFEFQSTDRKSVNLDIWELEVDSISAVGSNFEDFGSVHELISQVEEWQELKGPRTADTAHAVLKAVLLDITHYLLEERRLLPEDFHIIEDWWHWIESLGMRIKTDVPQTFPTKEIRDYRVAFTHNAANGSVVASSQGLLDDVVGGVAIHTPPNAILTTSEQQGTNGTPSLTVAKPYTSIGLVDFWFGCSAHTSESVANLATQCSVTVAAYQSPSDKQVAVAVFEFTPPAVSVSSVPMIQASLPSEFLLSGIKNITIVQDDPTTEALLVDSITYYLSK